MLLSSLDARTTRKIEAMRDRTMQGLGTDEPWVVEPLNIAINFRRRLWVDEVNLLPADDPPVRGRPGRA